MDIETRTRVEGNFNTFGFLPKTSLLNMQKQVAFFPGKLQVVFRKGPLGFLLQEPSDEAKRPPDHVLDKGQQTEEFFNRRTNDHPRWTIKTAEEYGISEKEEDFSCFDDVVGMLSVQQEHATGLDLFMDLIKNMLQVDPNQRITPVEALQHPFFNVKEEATSKEQCLENIQLTNYAVDQLEKPELVPPETVVSQENPAEVQPDNSGEDQLNDGFQTGDNTLNYTCFVNTLRTVGDALALPKRTEKFDWFGWF
ncbi:uncharacterized protein isoform X2 [Takifugu rubripes]|uniref:uncharacterized protein isoform X2 n=2 Tax=Takifugu rubripes TaxID=31033 RepID=UPI001145587E|nr:uncharacterized protein LOC105419264 isoform X2 [Takifugu rubripes]